MVGGYTLHSVEGVIARSTFREGCIPDHFNKSSSVHSYDDARSMERPKNMMVRIDEIVENKDDVLALGINNGDQL